MATSGDNYMNRSMQQNNQHHQIQQQQQQQHQHLHQIQEQNQYHLNQIPYAVMQSSSSSSIPGNVISKDSGYYDLGELDQSFSVSLDGQDPSTVPDQRNNSGMRPPTLNIFPSQPMHVEPPSSTMTNTGLVSPETSSGSKRPSESSMELANARNNGPDQPAKAVKALRRLAQNREAARKSRLRKKAYVQQLESSRIRLTQLEQELQRARTQGVFFGGGNILGGDQDLRVGINNISADAAMFDMEYARWLEEHHRLMCELRAAVHEHLPENELRIFVDNCLTHLEQVMNLKGMVAKTDVFHLVSGMWKTPAERCFMWMGGFRPSELIKVVLNQIEPLTEQQIMRICALQQSTQESEEALTQCLDALNQSLSDILTSDSLCCPPNMTNYMGQMAIAINKLSTLEGFVRQADNLRHQVILQLHQILTIHQAARWLLVMAEYFHRLRALSSLWLARPRQEQ